MVLVNVTQVTVNSDCQEQGRFVSSRLALSHHIAKRSRLEKRNTASPRNLDAYMSLTCVLIVVSLISQYH